MNNEYSDFECWYADCLLYCVLHPNKLWDEYEWSLTKSSEFIDYYQNGFTPEIAVKKKFNYGETLN